jgi:hypothetical protein
MRAATKNHVICRSRACGPPSIRLPTMMPVPRALLLTVLDVARSRASLQIELLALRHQLQVLRRTRPRQVALTVSDRWVWV